MNRNVDRDRGQKVRGIYRAVKERGDEGEVSIYTAGSKSRDI